MALFTFSITFLLTCYEDHNHYSKHSRYELLLEDQNTI